MRAATSRCPSRRAGFTPAGFTLVELLVVITIIGMLMAMLFPAYAAFWEKVNRMTCLNRLEDIGKNVRNFEQAKGRFPGYKERMPGGGGSGGNFRDISWIVALQEHSNSEVYEAIRSNSSTVPTQLRDFTCPSDATVSDEGRTSFVGNCGRKDTTGSAGSTPPDWPANGVFHRQAPKGSTKSVQFRSPDIVDGAQTTLLASENLQAGKWMSVNEADVGMLWFSDTKSPDFPSPDCKRINIDKEALPASDPDHARPSSHHADGVNVVFCDGSTRFLSDRIQYGQVYCKLMTPDGKRCADPGSKTLLKEPYNQPLDPALIQ